MTPVPDTIAGYLQELRARLEGSDPALIQDALYDAEEYLRAETEALPGAGEAEVVARVVARFGGPQEVAATYRETERLVARAILLPSPPASTWLGRFFGVAVDPRAYAALFYMFLSPFTGGLYGGWVIAGIGACIILAPLLVGLLLVPLFLLSVRALALVEGRLIEFMLGVRMPRRPRYAQPGTAFQRVRRLAADSRTWTTLLYMLLMIPLGLVYGTVSVWGLIFAYATAALPLVRAMKGEALFIVEKVGYVPSLWMTPVFIALGFVVLVLTLHLARGLGQLHGRLAKSLLVEPAAAPATTAAEAAPAPQTLRS